MFQNIKSCTRKWVFLYMTLSSTHAMACSHSEADYRLERLLVPPLTIRMSSLAVIPTAYELFDLYLDTLETHKNLIDTKSNLYNAYRLSQIINKHYDTLPTNFIVDYVRFIHAMPVAVKKHKSHPSARRRADSMQYINQLSFLVLHEGVDVKHLTNTIIREYDYTQDGIK